MMNFTNKIEIEKSKSNLSYLWKIKEINKNVVTFTKYQVSVPMDSISDENKSIITLKEMIGSETHEVTPSIQIELSGKVGNIIKNFKVKKFFKIVKVYKIIWI